MPVDFNPIVQGGGVQDVINQAQSRDVKADFNKEDPDDIARKALVKKVAEKKEQVKTSDVAKETFSREREVNEKMQQVIGGAAGQEAADGLKQWGDNKELQQKLTDGQKQLFREAMAKNPPKAGKAGKALDNLTKEPGFGKAVKTSQEMGTLQKALLENPQTEKAAGEMLKNRFMQSQKADPQTKSRFMEFGLRQAGKGQMESVKKAGDLLGSLTKSNVGRAGQRATMGMVQRNPTDGKAMSNVDKFLADQNVVKLPSFARTKGTELLAKANGKEEVAEGFKKLAGDPKLKAQTAENKGRFFSTIGTGRPSEYRAISDSLLTSLQSTAFPKRAGQVGKFLGQVSRQVQKGGAAAVDTEGAMKAAKSSPMPKLALVKMDPENMTDEELSQARSQNRANVMSYYNKLGRMYEGGEKKLKAAKYLEDVNKLQNLRPPENPDLSSLTPEEQVFVQERHQSAVKRHDDVMKLQRQRSRELRTKRRRGGSTGLHRAHGKQPKYFTPGATRRQPASQSFLQSTGTGGRQGLPANTARAQIGSRQQAASAGGGIAQQVQAALAGISGPMTADKAGQVAQAIASQVAQQVAQQVAASLVGAVEAGHMPATAPMAQQRPASAPKGQQGKVDGWGIPRTFERDLGGTQTDVVKPPVAEGPPAQTFAEAVEEKYSGKMLVKDASSVRELDSLFGARWKALGKPEMALLKNLGWNQQMWDTKDTPAGRWPGAMMTPFVNLSPVQREAVRKLGFTPHDWDKKVQAFSSGRNA